MRSRPGLRVPSFCRSELTFPAIDADTHFVKSLLAISIVLIALVTAPAASAQPVEVPYPTFTAMTEKYIYWTERWGTRCWNCINLYRYGLSDGKKTLVVKTRHARLGQFVAGGDTLAYSFSTAGSKYRTEIWALRDDGTKRKLAAATYRNRARSSCGAIASNFSVSGSGEVLWSVVTANSRTRLCGAPKSGWQRLRAAKVDSATRDIGGRTQLTDDFIFRFTELEFMRPIIGFNGTHVLFGGDAGDLAAYDTKSKKQVFFDRSQIRYVGDTAALSPTGAVALVRYSDDQNFRSFLYPNGMDTKRRTGISVAGGDRDLLRFCGGILVQMSVQKSELLMIKRDAMGTEASRTALPFPSATALDPKFDCNAATGLIRYANSSDDGAITSTVAELITL